MFVLVTILMKVRMEAKMEYIMQVQKEEKGEKVEEGNDPFKIMIYNSMDKMEYTMEKLVVKD